MRDRQDSATGLPGFIRGIDAPLKWGAPVCGELTLAGMTLLFILLLHLAMFLPQTFSG